MDLERIMLSEVSQLEKDEYHMLSRVESNEQNRNRGRDTWNRLTAVRGRGLGVG